MTREHQLRIRVRDLRKERAMTQEYLADLLGTSRQTINSLESGRCLPSLPLAMQIADIFSLPLEDIFVLDRAVARQLMAAHDELMSGSQLLLASTSGVYIPMDVYQTTTALVITAAIPGFSRDDVSVEVERQQLTLTGVRQPTDEERFYYQRETEIPLQFSREVTLSVPVDPDTAKATVTNGLLTVTIQLLETGQSRSIPVE